MGPWKAKQRVDYEAIIAHYGATTASSDGECSREQIQTAALVVAASELQSISSGIDQIRHFFHRLGEAKLRAIVEEQGLKHMKARRRRLYHERRARQKAKEGKK